MAEIANIEASRLRTQLKEGSGCYGRKKLTDREVVSKARVLTVEEGNAVLVDSACGTNAT